jgi:hypothetical protein
MLIFGLFLWMNHHPGVNVDRDEEKDSEGTTNKYIKMMDLRTCPQFHRPYYYGY